MVSSNLEQYTIADFIQWFEEKRLVLNPYFQRNRVWTPTVKSYLIDTILLDLPIPKIFLRTKIDLKTKKTIREVVDGQQRLSAIIDFASDSGFTLSSRSKEFAGLSYKTLPDDLKQKFLSYGLAVDNLINASDADVLSIFARLNSYGVKLNGAEKRHAEYQGEFKFDVIELTEGANALWDKFEIFTIRQRARMADYALVAECIGFLIEGVSDGGEARINRLYKNYDIKIPNKDAVDQHFKDTVALLTGPLAGVLEGAVTRPPHFLMLFAAVAHTIKTLPKGQLPDEAFAASTPIDLTKISAIEQSVALLSNAIEDDDSPPEFEDFVSASSSSTQRIASRRVRFPYYVRALHGEFA